MRNISKLALAAPLGLALIFTFSCSDLPDFQDTPVGGNSSVTGNQSSPSGNSSSSVDSPSSPSRSSSSSLTGSSSSLGRSSSSAIGISSSLGISSSSATISSSSLNDKSGTFKDSRDNKSYKWVKIGNQIWMAENLNYNDASGSVCYDNKTANCNRYGRLYNQEAAIDACPANWHLPSAAEWEVMLKFVDKTCGQVGEYDGSQYEYCNNAGYILKADDGWDDYEGIDGNGVDRYGFSALPGGAADDEDTFDFLGSYGFWWGSDYNYEVYTSHRGNVLIYDYDGYNSLLYSVRCVKN